MEIEMSKKKDAALTKRGADELRKKINGIVENTAKASMDVCWALYETERATVNIGGKVMFVFEAWGFKEWGDYVGHELHLHPTTAFAYRKVWEVFYVDLAGAWDKNLLLPITKMRTLTAANLTKKNVNAWLKKAAKMTCAQLVAEVYETEELKHFHVSLTKRQHASVNRSLLLARETFPEGGDMPRGDVLFRIVDEWAALIKKSKGRKLRLAG